MSLDKMKRQILNLEQARQAAKGGQVMVVKVMNPQPPEGQRIDWCGWVDTGFALQTPKNESGNDSCTCKPWPCPYKEIGEQRWAAETWQVVSGTEDWMPIEECDTIYRATDEHPGYDATEYAYHINAKEDSYLHNDDVVYPWRSSATMSHRSSRTTLTLRSVDVKKNDDGLWCWFGLFDAEVKS